MEYRITFIGRTKGALGARSKFTVTAEAPTPQDAILSLYDNYELLGCLTLNGKSCDHSGQVKEDMTNEH